MPDRDDEAPATDEQAPGEDMVMNDPVFEADIENDPEPEADIEEISTGGALADPMKQVCHLLVCTRY